MKDARFSLLVLLLACMLSAYISNKVAMSQIKKEYPFLRNIQHEGVYEIGDCWLTKDFEDSDNYSIHVYTAAGWEKVFTRFEGTLLYKHQE